MYANRTVRQPLSPTGVVAAIGVNVVLIGGLMLSAPDILPQIETAIRARNIPLVTPPPPPEPPPPTDNRDIRTQAPLPKTIDPIVPLPPLPNIGVTTAADPLPDPGPFVGTGTTSGTVVDPPAPLPVLVAATPDPRAAADFQPPYPPAERREGVEGRITVRVLIGVDGRVKAVKSVASDRPGFFEATRRQALARWRFRPATRDGVPYEVWKTMTVRFQLRD